MKEPLKGQAADGQYQAATPPVGLHASFYFYDRAGILIQTDPIDGAIQKFVPVTLLVHILYLTHYPALAEHPKEERMYERTGQNFYWPKMVNDAYTPVQNFCSWAQIGSHMTLKSKSSALFSSSILSVRSH